MGDLFEFLLFAVPIGGAAIYGVYAVNRRITGLRVELAEQRGSNRTAQIATEKSELEERVRVLERIVTDKGYSLSEEIEGLRDSPKPSADTGIPLNIRLKETQS